MLGLAHHPAFAAPAVERGVSEVVEPAGGLAGGAMLGFGRGQPVLDRSQQAAVAGEAEEVIDAVGFAPAHQLVPGKTRIGPEHDLHPWPAGADLGRDAFDLIEGTR